MHTRLAEVGYTQPEIRKALLALRRHELYTAISRRHHHIVHLVHVLTGLRARRKPPFRHANAVVVDLHGGDGLRQLAHLRSSGKYLSTDRTGLGAAWPRPQMEASAITSDRSASRSGSQLPALISWTAFSVPLRQGVHWPQLSSSKKRIRLSATAFMSSLPDRMTTAWLSTKLPCFSSWPKSSGISAM